MEERIVKKLMTSVKCTNCGRNYQMRDVKILGNHEDIWFLQVSCSSCHSRYLITAVIDQEGIAEGKPAAIVTRNDDNVAETDLPHKQPPEKLFC